MQASTVQAHMDLRQIPEHEWFYDSFIHSIRASFEI